MQNYVVKSASPTREPSIKPSSHVSMLSTSAPPLMSRCIAAYLSGTSFEGRTHSRVSDCFTRTTLAEP
jgi:hypothetical protein